MALKILVQPKLNGVSIISAGSDLRVPPPQGASILRMLENFMGKSFQMGINTFLKKFEYANAVTQDLWNELTAAWAGSVPEGEKVRCDKAYMYCVICVRCHSSQKDTKKEFKMLLSLIFVILVILLSYLLSWHPNFSGRCWGHHEHLDPADGLPCGDCEALCPSHLHSLSGTLLAGPKCRLQVSFLCVFGNRFTECN